jgi:hypothetical protein
MFLTNRASDQSSQLQVQKHQLQASIWVLINEGAPYLIKHHTIHSPILLRGVEINYLSMWKTLYLFEDVWIAKLRTFWPLLAMQEWVVNFTPPGTRLAGGWVGPRAGLETAVKSLCPQRIEH